MGNAECEFGFARSMNPAVLTSKSERAKQGHIAFHVGKIGCPKDSPMATPIAMNAQYLGSQEYGVEAVMRHDGSLR